MSICLEVSHQTTSFFKHILLFLIFLTAFPRVVSILKSESFKWQKSLLECCYGQSEKRAITVTFNLGKVPGPLTSTVSLAALPQCPNVSILQKFPSVSSSPLNFI